MDYGLAEAQSSELSVELAEIKCKVSVLTTKGVKVGNTAWLMVKQEHDNHNYYVVGIQDDGSIVRAMGCDGLGFPIDPRTGDGHVAIKLRVKK